MKDDRISGMKSKATKTTKDKTETQALLVAMSKVACGTWPTCLCSGYRCFNCRAADILGGKAK